MSTPPFFLSPTICSGLPRQDVTPTDGYVALAVKLVLPKNLDPDESLINGSMSIIAPLDRDEAGK